MRDIATSLFHQNDWSNVTSLPFCTIAKYPVHPTRCFRRPFTTAAVWRGRLTGRATACTVLIGSIIFGCWFPTRSITGCRRCRWRSYLCLLPFGRLGRCWRNVSHEECRCRCHGIKVLEAALEMLKALWMLTQRRGRHLHHLPTQSYTQAIDKQTTRIADNTEIDQIKRHATYLHARLLTRIQDASRVE